MYIYVAIWYKYDYGPSVRESPVFGEINFFMNREGPSFKNMDMLIWVLFFSGAPSQAHAIYLI